MIYSKVVIDEPILPFLLCIVLPWSDDRCNHRFDFYHLETPPRTKDSFRTSVETRTDPDDYFLLLSFRVDDDHLDCAFASRGGVHVELRWSIDMISSWFNT